MQKKLFKPRHLKKGSVVVAVAFSDRVTKRDIKDLLKSVELLEKWGLKVILSKHLTDHLEKKSLPSPEMVIAEMLMWAKNDVDAFYCVRGGFDANRLFHYKKFDHLLKTISDKRICVLGFSDATTLETPLVYNNLASFYCPNLIYLHKRSEKTKKSLHRVIFSKKPLRESIKNLEVIQSFDEKKIKGVLITGNLMTMHDCLASDYNPLTKFNEVILMVEEIEESEENVARFLSTMTAYSSVKAAIINFRKKTGLDFSRKVIKSMLKRISADDIPVFWYKNFGHLPGTQFFKTLGVGWPVEITVKHGNKGKLEFLPLK